MRSRRQRGCDARDHRAPELRDLARIAFGASDWDLHVGVSGAAIPADVRQIGESFNTVLAYRNPRDPLVYEHYMKVRAKLDFLKQWIDARVADVANGKVQHPEKTFVHYWLKNAGDGSHFSRKDVVFEAFHNFVALSQWGNTMFGITSRRLRRR